MSKAAAVKEARQRQLIDATIASIGRRGYANTTLAHVASEAGLSPGIVNFYFRSKEQLLAATLEQIAEEYETFWRAELAAAGDSPAAALAATIEADFHPAVFTLEKVAVWFAFWAEAQSQPGYRELVSKLEARYFEETRALCQRLIDEGGYDGIDAGAVAAGLNAMIDGFWFDFLIDPRAFHRQGAIDTCRLFLGGLFPREFGRAAGAAEQRPEAARLRLVGEDAAAEAATLVEDGRVFGCQAHRGRLAVALRQRLQPNAPLTREALAAMVGVPAATVQAWLDERDDPSSWILGKLLVIFDPLFWSELYGPIGEAMRRRFEARIAAAREAEARERAALEGLLGPRA